MKENEIKANIIGLSIFLFTLEKEDYIHSEKNTLFYSKKVKLI